MGKYLGCSVSVLKSAVADAIEFVEADIASLSGIITQREALRLQALKNKLIRYQQVRDVLQPK
jgi:diphthamide synthase subunit DPH2